LAFVDATVVNVALPAIEADFGSGLAGEQWIVLSYSLALAALYLPGGSLGDRFGRRRVFVAGTIGFAIASVLCGVAPGQEVLIAGRVLQGITGGLLTPTSLGLLRATYGRDAGRAIGHWSAWTGIATVAGPLAGGAFVDWVSWRWIFLLNLPLAAAAALLALAAGADDDEERTDEPLDYVGAALAALSFGTITFALVDAGRHGFGDPSVATALAAGAAVLGGFVLYERRIAHPLLPLELLRRRNFAAGNIETLLVYGALYASTFLLTLYLQALGHSAFVTGVLTVPISVVLLVGAAAGGRLADRHGPRLPLTLGPLVLAAGTLLLLIIRPGSSWPIVLPGVLVFGIGLCGIVAPITAVVLQAAPRQYSGLAAGVSVTVARVGGLVAIAVVGLVAAEVFQGHSGTRGAVPLARDESPRFHAASEDAFRVGMLICAGLALAGAAVAFVGISDAEARAEQDVAAIPT
jgi:EmrB/QacA subfamily drug resistance transporter